MFLETIANCSAYVVFVSFASLVILAGIDKARAMRRTRWPDWQ